MEYMYLQGSEEVGRAASSMKGSAEEMNRAAANIERSLERHQRFLDDWLYRLEQIIEKMEKKELP